MRTWLVGLVMFVLGGLAGLCVRGLWDPPLLPPGMESRWEATLYLPAPVAGEVHLTEDAWKSAVTEFTKPFGGATLASTVEGIWHAENGVLQSETVRPVIVSFRAEQLGEFRERLRNLRARLRQEALYIRYERPLIELHGR